MPATPALGTVGLCREGRGRRSRTPTPTPLPDRVSQTRPGMWKAGHPTSAQAVPSPYIQGGTTELAECWKSLVSSGREGGRELHVGGAGCEPTEGVMSLPDTPLSSWPPIPGSTGPETQPAAPHSGCDGAWPHSLVSVGLCHPQDSPCLLWLTKKGGPCCCLCCQSPACAPTAHMGP